MSRVPPCRVGGKWLGQVGGGGVVQAPGHSGNVPLQAPGHSDTVPRAHRGNAPIHNTSIHPNTTT